MQYKAENVDTDKALNYIELCRKGDAEQEYIEKVSVEKLHEGVRKGLDIAEGIFLCRNYEQQATPASFKDGINHAICLIGKELGIVYSDIQKSGKNCDEMCSIFAKRILSVFERKDGTENMRETMEVSHG